MAFFDDFIAPVVNPVGGAIGQTVGGLVGAPVRGITNEVVPGIDYTAQAPELSQTAFRSPGLRRAAARAQRFAAGAQARLGQATGNQQAARAQQMQALELQRQAAEGNAPSVAQNQLRAGLENQLRQQQAMAASDTANPALARRNAMLAGNQLGLQTNQQAAQLRAQEMAQARAGLAQQAGALRGADLSAAQMAGRQFLGGTQTGMGANQALMNAQMERERLRQQGIMGAQDINARLRGAEAENRAKFAGGMISGAGAALGGLLSDADAKKEIKDAGKGMDDFARSLAAKMYRYDNNAPDEIDKKRKRYGILAQDLERTPAGRSIVDKGPDGLRRVDVANGLGLALATIGRLGERLEELEYKKKGKKGRGKGGK